jgi:hypothetical protein
LLNELRSTGIHENGWSFNPNVGSYGTDYLLRAAVARFGLGANSSRNSNDLLHESAGQDASNLPSISIDVAAHPLKVGCAARLI